jgi:phosphopantothenoylcysteine synthetase/decarboxylase
MKQLNVMVTSGGTISRIDDIRHIGNFSKGTTGAIIAEEFLKNNHQVYYVYGQDAKRPFRRNMAVDPKNDFKKEISKIQKNYKQFINKSHLLKEHNFVSFEDYYNILKRILINKKIDVIILAAAVSDYEAEKINGKISSDKEELELKLKKTKKIISLIKKWHPDIFQVGFKLLADIRPKELIKKANKHGNKNKSDLTIANSFNRGLLGNALFIITPNKEFIETNRKKLATDLYKILIQRLK